jgi:hypothetical protein
METFNLQRLVTQLVLVVGFSQPLSSLPLIEAAIAQQNADIDDGKIPYLVPVDQADFGVDIVYKTSGPGILLSPETPDHTMVPVSPTHPK